MTGLDVKELRERLAFTRSELARVLSVARFSVERWETGASSPAGLSLEVLTAIAMALEVVDAKNVSRALWSGGIGGVLFGGLITRPRRPSA